LRIMNKAKYTWATSGDVNAFFGLLLDNIAGLVLMVGLLVGVFGMPADFVLSHMVPGTAIGVLVGDILYFFLAFRLASKTGRNDVTAMPLGLDTPSIFGLSIFVVGAAYSNSLQSGKGSDEAAMFAWHIGICCMVYSGIFKTLCSFGGSWIRRVIPRAGLFGSLTSIALVIISFVPLIDIFREPIVGLVALSIVLTTLVGRVPLPWNIPGTLAALLVGGVIHYLQRLVMGQPLLSGETLTTSFLPTEWTAALGFHWWEMMGAAANYLPVALPFALATVVGGIDCTESAAAAGDEYPTGQVLGVEAIATFVAGICGGVIQTTPYIGHPAYKAMGGRAAYVLATALTIGFIGVIGGFTYFYLLIPKPAVYPILIFIGLEISAQSFMATPRRHYPALVLACVPALAFLAYLFAEQLLGSFGIVSLSQPADIRPDIQQAMQTLQEKTASDPQLSEPVQKIVGVFTVRPDLRSDLQTLQLMKNGFILTSLLWASFLAMAIDRELKKAAVFLGIAGLFTLFGLIHCPLASNALFLPVAIPGLSEAWVLPAEHRGLVFPLAFGYFLTAGIMALWSVYLGRTGQSEPILDHDHLSVE
jgi:adenine/guanine/hypoxanthine permease